jgi:AbrB family transcriptional regulator, transcriptional pleiotropic regulator of transition state genes
MKTGIQRKVDDLGRVVIPVGIRRSLGIREGDPLDVHVEGDRVILSKPTDECVFCGAKEALRSFRGKPVCGSCAAAIGRHAEERRSDESDSGGGEDAQDPESTTAW